MTVATLTQTQLAECKQIYEQTPLILQAIADRYGVRPHKVAHLAKHHHWQRYQPPVDPEQFERDVEDAVAFAENDAIATALREAMKAHWQDLPPPHRGPVPKRRKKDQTGRQAGRSRVRQHREVQKSLKTESGRSTNVVPFPGAVPPPSKQDEIAPVDIFNVHTRAEQARLRIELGQLRGAMSLQQLQGLQRTRAVIDDYEHYFRVYLRPQDYLPRDGMDNAVYQERLTQLRKQALLYIAPTERDTLAGALKCLVGARETLISVERLVSGASGQRGVRQLTPDAEPLGQNDAADLSTMDVATLRQVKGAMEALQGQRSAATEPPKPPPPEPLTFGASANEPDNPDNQPGR